MHKEERECKGAVAHYYSDPERFEVTGNPAELFDPVRGRSFAPRLTYIVADDRICTPVFVPLAKVTANRGILKHMTVFA